jgi:RimJ/RimL family protein N-acetyltransferase
MIGDVGPANLEAVREFLQAHLDTSLFLLGNLATHGPRLGEHLNSGNFRLLEEHGRIAAVFCLARRGNLLLQTGGRADLGAVILQSCREEEIPIHGVIGEWNGAHALWHLLCADPRFKPNVTQREVLYGRELPLAQASDSTLRVRALEIADFEAWNVLNVAYCAEVQVPLPGSRDERRTLFAAQAEAGCWWGCFDGEDLIGTASLNAQYERVGQVGGVYTRPGYRGRGLAGITMQKLMYDAFHRYRLERLILFTGEDNRAARRLYESLGFRVIGYFGLLFGVPETVSPRVL